MFAVELPLRKPKTTPTFQNLHNLETTTLQLWVLGAHEKKIVTITFHTPLERSYLNC